MYSPVRPKRHHLPNQPAAAVITHADLTSLTSIMKEVFLVEYCVDCGCLWFTTWMAWCDGLSWALTNKSHLCDPIHYLLNIQVEGTPMILPWSSSVTCLGASLGSL